jgi:ribonucleoside-diphosphate reductase alpha chain
MAHAEQPTRTLETLPAQEISRDVLLEKYAKGGETSAAEVRARVARALSSVEPEAKRAHWEARFLEAQEKGFIPAGRINSAAGTPLPATLINCFVQPVGDSITEVVDGKPGIYTALAEAAETMRRGGGVGYDFRRSGPRRASARHALARERAGVVHARVRPVVRAVGARARAAERRWACCVATIRTSSAFIHAKDTGELTNFNISVGVTDAFMRAVEGDEESSSCTRPSPARRERMPGRISAADGSWVYRKVRARELWEQVMRSTYDHAEPGVLFLDRVNRDNNLHYCETSRRATPAARSPARVWLLLPRLDRPHALRARSVSRRRAFDFDSFARDRRGLRAHARQRAGRHALAPQQQDDESKAKRRIGLGFTGSATRCDAAAALRHRKRARHGREDLRVHARSRILALDRARRGARRVPDVQQGSLSVGRQLRLAPAAGTEGRDPQARHPQLAPARDRAHRHHQPRLADNASNGIEPPFSWT